MGRASPSNLFVLTGPPGSGKSAILLLRRSIENFESARVSGERVLFDRGIPDCVVYAMTAGTDPGPSVEGPIRL